MTISIFFGQKLIIHYLNKCIYTGIVRVKKIHLKTVVFFISYVVVVVVINAVNELGAH